MNCLLLLAVEQVVSLSPIGDEARRPPRRHPLREQLIDQVTKRPGSRLFDVAAALGAKRSTAKHHLGILEQVGLVKVVRSGDSTRYFPGSFLSEYAEDVAVVLRGRILEVTHEIVAKPGIRQVELTRGLQLSRKVFRVYANLLIRRGLLTEEAGFNTLRYFPTDRLRLAIDSVKGVGK